MKQNDSPKFGSSLPQLVPYVTQHSLWLALVAVTAVLGGILDLLYPFFLMEMTDSATAGKTEIFTTLVFWAIFSMLVRIGMTYLQGQATVRYETLTIRDFRNKITRHIQQLPISYTDTFHSGDLVSRLNNDVNKIAELLKHLYEMIQQPIIFVLGFMYMIFISWKLLLAACILIPLSGFVQNLVTKPLQSHSQKEMEALARANALTQDMIHGIYVIKAFNLQGILTNKYKNIAEQIEKAGIEIEKRSGLSTAVFLALRYIPQLIVPLYGGYLAFLGEITVGALLASLTLIWSVFLPIEKMLGWMRVIREATPAIDRIFELLDHPVESSGTETNKMPVNPVPVRMRNVSFQYEGDDQWVLKSLSLEVEAGKVIGLVGPSGCGKSTLLKILCGFYQPQQGEVEIFGTPVYSSNLSEVRKKVALVSQSTFLFPTTIRENIAYGRQDATFKEIMAAAQAANAHGFIQELPEGYETQVGEWGAKLSGGQKQRIAIARAILKDADILLLDEPTSALDTQSEVWVQEALDRLMVGKAVIIVAHRLSTLKTVDEIFVLENGVITERGTHEELMAQDSLYQRLYQQQMYTDILQPSEQLEV